MLFNPQTVLKQVTEINKYSQLNGTIPKTDLKLKNIFFLTNNNDNIAGV